MKLRKALASWLVRRTRGPVRGLLRLYGIRLNHLGPTGSHLVIFRGGQSQAETLPESTIFNTRSGEIVVEEDVVFGEDVQLLTGKHLSAWEATTLGLPLHYVPPNGRDIRIGRGSYVGSGALVIGPVTLGEYSVVGAGSVVTRDVPPFTFVAGVPAQVRYEVPAVQRATILSAMSAVPTLPTDRHSS